MTTKPDTRELSQAQLTAIDLLVAGSTVTAAAEAVGVGRQAASEWLNRNSEFKAALNRRRLEIWGETNDRLRGMLPKALDCIETCLESGDGPDRLRAALGVLKIAGVGDLAKVGETNAGLIRDQELLVDIMNATTQTYRS